MTRGPFIRNWLTMAEEAETPFAKLGGDVPRADADFTALRSSTTTAPDGPVEFDPGDDFPLKVRNLARSFDGQPELLLLNAKLITLLRRRAPPTHVPKLFQRLWAQEHSYLTQALPARWLISTAQTMGDHGATQAQRRAGGELATLFAMIKLYETERLFSGRMPEDLFTPGQARPEALALDLSAFAIARGDLDRTLISRLWRLTDADPVSRSIGHKLLRELLADDRAIFRRLRKMRDRRRAAKEDGDD